MELIDIYQSALKEIKRIGWITIGKGEKREELWQSNFGSKDNQKLSYNYVFL